MGGPSRIVAILTAHPGMADRLHALLHGMIPHCRAEPGNLRWDIWQDLQHADRYLLDELYAGPAALAAHRETPHYRYYLEGIDELAECVVLLLEPVAVGNPKP